ncbi:MAG TPA: ExeM/NucH family extracellular endonuclease, partial [Marinobacter sp.]|nr:ExeM/NucH family extracellular endonuclease [Marinobacter sp.]
CGAPADPIHRIQGPGEASPLAGQQVTVEGILTRDARGEGGFRGFYLQQGDADTDDDPRTSEALFVYTPRKTGQPGDRLRVTGTVKEFHGLTELVDVRAVDVCGTSDLPEPIPISLPWSRLPESLENMRVAFTQPLTVIEHYQLAVFGELTLAERDQIIPTEYLPPGREAIAQSKRNLEHRVLLDDGKGVRHPRPIPWPTGGLGADSTVRAGDQVRRLTGILDYRFGYWRVQPESPPAFSRPQPRPAPPPRHPQADLRLVAFNLQNYFNGNGQGGGFPTERGAQSLAEFERQSRQLTRTLIALDADLLALTELENDGRGEHSALRQLVRALGEPWRAVLSSDSAGTDAIRTALLYRSDRLRPTGAGARIRTGVYRSVGRPPLAQRFDVPGTGTSIQLVVPHLKSKSCQRAKGPDTDQNDGQGCYSMRRLEEARAITQWLGQQNPDADNLTLIAGDLNSYSQESPLQHFAGAGYTSVVPHFHPCTPEACDHHSYRFKGEKGALDHILVPPDLLSRVLSASTWNVNADEPRALAELDMVPADQPWRASDHNPVVVDLRLVP